MSLILSYSGLSDRQVVWGDISCLKHSWTAIGQGIQTYYLCCPGSDLNLGSGCRWVSCDLVIVVEGTTLTRASSTRTCILLGWGFTFTQAWLKLIGVCVDRSGSWGSPRKVANGVLFLSRHVTNYVTSAVENFALLHPLTLVLSTNTTAGCLQNNKYCWVSTGQYWIGYWINHWIGHVIYRHSFHSNTYIKYHSYKVDVLSKSA